jgi:murein DD-endopeptidase MepM/ murein hydrolase activator NlpD
VAGFDWNLDSRDETLGRRDDPVADLLAAVAAADLPTTDEPARPAQVKAPADAALPQALTRRELRNRENSARLAASAAAPEPAPAATFFTAPIPVVEAASAERSSVFADMISDVAPQRPAPRAVKRAGLVKPPRASARPPKRGTTTARARKARAPKPPRVSGYHFKRKLVSKLASIGAVLGVGALVISTSLPANAFFNPDAAVVGGKTLSAGVQSIRVGETAVDAIGERDGYTVTSLADQLRLKYGNQSFLYTNDPNGTIQWPFPLPVPISSGFGARHVAGCSGCSTYHEGVDFIPGAGVAIDAIADGVVSQVVNSHAGLGNHVVIDHVINGQKVQSVYGHMLDGSIRVTVGEPVTVTQQIGQVGSTGESTGAHLHLEIHLDGVPVDPFAWLKANAN